MDLERTISPLERCRRALDRLEQAERELERLIAEGNPTARTGADARPGRKGKKGDQKHRLQQEGR